MTMRSLPERVAALESSAQARFGRLFDTSITTDRASPEAIVCKKQSKDSRAAFYLFTWNRLCGSHVHGHAQMVLHTRFPSPRLGLLIDAARRYRTTGNNYFDDLWLAHHALGLGIKVGTARVIASLTPIKERECLILARTDDGWHDLARALTLVLTMLQADLPHGLLSFNLAIYSAPLAPVAGWEDFPILVRVTDRGWPLLGVVDMASMELYAESIVAHDPFVLADALRRHVVESP